MYQVICIDGDIRQFVSTNNKPDRYGTPKNFETYKDAMAWIRKRSYKGMSYKYEIRKEVNSHD